MREDTKIEFVAKAIQKMANAYQDWKTTPEEAKRIYRMEASAAVSAINKLNEIYENDRRFG